MTLDQFLAWEEQQELRYEFDISLPEIGIDLPLSEIYADIVFPPEADDTAH